MLYEIPIIKHDQKGSLSKYIIGTCDDCNNDNNEIDNSKESFIQSDNSLIYHIKCYKGN